MSSSKVKCHDFRAPSRKARIATIKNFENGRQLYVRIYSLLDFKVGDYIMFSNGFETVATYKIKEIKDFQIKPCNNHYLVLEYDPNRFECRWGQIKEKAQVSF